MQLDWLVVCKKRDVVDDNGLVSVNGSDDSALEKVPSL